MKIFTGVTLACLAFGILYAVSHRRGGRGPIPDKGKAFIFVVTALIFSFLVIAHAVLLFANIYPDLSFIFSTVVDLPLQICR